MHSHFSFPPLNNRPLKLPRWWSRTGERVKGTSLRCQQSRGVGRGPELSPPPPSGEGGESGVFPSPVRKDFQTRCIGHQHRQGACRVSLPPSRHFPSCRLSRRSFQIACFIDISSAALRWDSLGATGWLPGPSPAVFPPASALGAVASRGVGSQGDAAPGQTRSSPVGFGEGWGRFSQHSRTLGPYKIGCPSPVVLTKAGPF